MTRKSMGLVIRLMQMHFNGICQSALTTYCSGWRLITCNSIHPSWKVYLMLKDLSRSQAVTYAVKLVVSGKWCRIGCLNGTAPSYLAESICRVADVEGHRHLRSSATTSLIVPPVRRSTLCDRSFPAVAAARACNSLPPVIRSASSLITFQRELKTFLYHCSFVNQ